MSTNITPLHDAIVRALKRRASSWGNHHPPIRPRKSRQEGEVVAARAGKYKEDGRDSLSTSNRDRVLFWQYSGSEIKIDGERAADYREDEILGNHRRAGAATGTKKGGK